MRGACTRPVAPRKNFPLRLSPELYAALERWAADEMRSVNGQIEYLLSQAVKQAGRARTHPSPEPEPESEDQTDEQYL